MICLLFKVSQSFCMDRNTLAIREFCAEIRVKMSFLIRFIAPLIIYHNQNVNFLMHSWLKTISVYLFICLVQACLDLLESLQQFVNYACKKHNIPVLSIHTCSRTKKKKTKNPTHQAYHFSTICCGIKRYNFHLCLSQDCQFSF